MIYIIRCLNYFKVGVASDLNHRLSQIQTSCPVKIDVVATLINSSKKEDYRIEKIIHTKYKIYNSCGEWFLLSKCMLNTIVKEYGFKKSANIELFSTVSQKMDESEYSLDRMLQIVNSRVLKLEELYDERLSYIGMSIQTLVLDAIKSSDEAGAPDYNSKDLGLFSLISQEYDARKLKLMSFSELKKLSNKTSFLINYMQLGSIQKTCSLLGISRSRLYDWINNDSMFKVRLSQFRVLYNYSIHKTV
jgi:hypothetical protein